MLSWLGEMMTAELYPFRNKPCQSDGGCFILLPLSVCVGIVDFTYAFFQTLFGRRWSGDHGQYLFPHH